MKTYNRCKFKHRGYTIENKIKEFNGSVPRQGEWHILDEDGKRVKDENGKVIPVQPTMALAKSRVDVLLIRLDVN